MNSTSSRTLVLDFAQYGDNCLLSKRLRESGHEVSQYKPNYCQAINNEWEKEYDTIVLPPGSLMSLAISMGCFSESDWKSKSDSTSYRIKRFIEECGGSIIGVCAGAMALATDTLATKESGQVLSMNCGLGLFDSPAMHYKKASKSWQMISLHTAFKNFDPLEVKVPYYDGACLLTTDEELVAARYAPYDKKFHAGPRLSHSNINWINSRNSGEFKNPPAIAIKSFRFNGKAVFIGCHPEVQQSAELSKIVNISHDFSQKLDAETEEIQVLWSQVVQSLKRK